jgi:hypothetical protein
MDAVAGLTFDLEHSVSNTLTNFVILPIAVETAIVDDTRYR